MSTFFEIGSLATVKSEIDQAFRHARERLAACNGEADAQRSLQLVLARLHQAAGALQVIGLAGAARLAAEMEVFTGLMAKRALEPAPANLQLVMESITVLATYLDSLMAGAADRPLLLFPHYEALQRARGLMDVSPSDLFFPDTRQQLEMANQPVRQLPETALAECLKSCRQTYEQGLGQWTCPTDAAGIDAMCEAVASIETLQADAASRTFWQVARTLLEGVRAGRIPPGEHLQQLASRLALQIRKLVLPTTDGNGNEQLLRGMLFYLAQCSHPDPGIVAIRQLFRLDEQLPSQAPLLPVTNIDLELQSRLRRLLAATGHQWAEAASGDPLQLAAFGQGSQQLMDELSAWGLPCLSLLASRLHAVAQSLAPAVIAPPLALEVATSILLIDVAVEHNSLLSAEFPSLVEQQAEYLRQAAAGQDVAAVPRHWQSLFNPAGRQAQDLLLLRHVTEAVRGNLAAIAGALETYEQAPDEPAPLSQATLLLRQAAGAFEILALNDAARLVRQCIARLEQVRCGAGAGASCADLESMADAIVSLEFYVIGLQHGQANHEHWLATGLARLAAPPPSAAAAAVPPAIATGQPRQPQPPAASGLAPFLQEAGVVLDQIGQLIASLELGEASPQAMAILGEAWQRLGDSSEAAHQQTLAAAARAMAQACRHPALDHYLADPEFQSICHPAHDTVALWLMQLERGETPDPRQWPEAGIRQLLNRLASRYQADETHVDLARHRRRPPAGRGQAADASMPDAAGQPATPATGQEAAFPGIDAPQEEDLVIGPTRVAPDLFALFLQEARGCMAALQAGYLEVSERAGTVSDDFMLAAHTLVGIARTVQCQPLADVSRALETRLHQLLEAGQAPGHVDLALMAAAQTAIAEMLDAFAACRYPEPATALLQSLQTAARAPAIASPLSMAPLAGTPVAVTAVPPVAVPLPGDNRAANAADNLAEQEAANQAPAGDAIDGQLLPVFLEEAAELYPALCRDFRQWQEWPQQAQWSATIQRVLHTLKGSARMAGATRLGALAHEMESILLAASDGQPTAEQFQRLEADIDRMGLLIGELAAAPTRAGDGPAPARPRPAVSGTAGPVAPASRSVLRIAARVVDDLVNDAGEISIARAGVHENVHAIAAACSELASHIMHLQEQIRQVEIQAESRIQAGLPDAASTDQSFDPLEFDRFTELHPLVRRMADTVNEVGLLHARLLSRLDSADHALRQQTRAVRQLQQALMRIRMLPFGTVTERFYQIARQVGRQLDRHVVLHIEGESVEIDRSVLEAVTAPLEHLLRNAIDHGIEAPGLRRAGGKPEKGQVTISAQPGRNEVILQVRDDGGGLDPERLWRKGVERGLLAHDASPSLNDLVELIFLPGFSTAATVTEISGRGMGMDVVGNDIHALGGRIDVQSQPGQGTCFTIYLPLTLATMQVVLVRAGSDIYAIPAVMVEKVRMQKEEEIAAHYAARHILWEDRHYPFFHLGELVGQPALPGAWPPHNSVLLLESGHGRASVHVDEIVGSQEVVVKNIGPQLARVPGIAGATILASGKAVVILNPVVLAGMRSALAATDAAAIADRQLSGMGYLATDRPPPGAAGDPPAAMAPTPAAAPLVMVVDDSLTVRKVTTGFLRRAGFAVASAKDGIEALAQIQEEQPDLMLVDVEMPGMDGFDLTRNIRGTPHTAAIPIIMITSRTADKHRQYAMRLGVNAYLGKPYQEDELLGEIRRLLARS